jgi:rhodanese-related sulfurtransferase
MHALASVHGARRVVLLLGIPCLLAVTVNLLRSHPLPWVANRPYEILHDCPEAARTAGVISPAEALQKPGRILFVDSRSRVEFLRDHAEGALSVPYDPLLPPREQDLQAIRARRARWILVYGSGETAQLAADELATAHLTGVLRVEGGLAALHQAGVRSSSDSAQEKQR